MSAPLYTTTATATGEGRAATDDGLLDVTLAVPASRGGPGGATSPEQLFAAGWAPCFHSALKMVDAQRNVSVAESTVIADISITETDTGGLASSTVVRVHIGGGITSATAESQHPAPGRETMTITDTTFAEALRRLYLTRFAFAAVWAGLVFATAGTSGPLLTLLLVIYPLFDAGAVVWQLRAEKEAQRSQASAWTNVIVSIAVAVALGVASTITISAALAVWGAWAIGSGIPQLITALRNRRSGGQVAQMLSGGISVLAGTGFLVQGLHGAENIAGAAGYATLGGIFFLISAIRLGIILRAAAV